jgi:hypothetical protein
MVSSVEREGSDSQSGGKSNKRWKLMTVEADAAQKKGAVAACCMCWTACIAKPQFNHLNSSHLMLQQRAKNSHCSRLTLKFKRLKNRKLEISFSNPQYN